MMMLKAARPVLDIGARWLGLTQMCLASNQNFIRCEDMSNDASKHAVVIKQWQMNMHGVKRQNFGLNFV